MGNDDSKSSKNWVWILEEIFWKNWLPISIYQVSGIGKSNQVQMLSVLPRVAEDRVSALLKSMAVVLEESYFEHREKKRMCSFTLFRRIKFWFGDGIQKRTLKKNYSWKKVEYHIDR